jgi:hypothetical protein
MDVLLELWSVCGRRFSGLSWSNYEMNFSTMTDAQPRDLLEAAALLLMRLQDDAPLASLVAPGHTPSPSVLGSS